MQVVAYYQEAIRAGKLRPGDELPSTRRVADEWDVSVSTAQRALEALRDEGWTQTRAGRPAVVTSGHVPSADG